MIARQVLRGAIFCFLLLGAIPAGMRAQTKPGAHLIITHKVFSHPQRRGRPLAIDATITSPAGIRKAEVFCRPAGAREFTALPMVQKNADVYRAVVPDWMTAGPGLEYYISATDQLGRSASHGFIGFPLLVRLASTQPPTREERLKSLQDTLDIIRKNRAIPADPLSNDPLLERNR